MNTTKRYLISLAAAGALLAASALPASAAILGSKVTLNSTTTLDTAAQTKADAAINARVSALNLLQTRINQMVYVSSSEKSSLDASIQTALGQMTALEAKINADTDNATLKADIQSITKSYRIYILILPQGRITAASDRVVTIVNLFNTLSLKLQARVSAAQTAGQDVTSLDASLSDMSAKMAAANTAAQAAVSAVANLQPDNGNQTVYASNETALKGARGDIQTATADLKAARQDAASVIKALLSMKAGASASTTTTGQ